MQEEKWICKQCGDEAPCILTIKYSDEKLPEHLKGRQRLVKETCPCAAYPTAQWERDDPLD
ncbi:MAG: hypothetical protein WC373_14855 [Smithella sp.]|jgi:hypothetical protein